MGSVLKMLVDIEKITEEVITKKGHKQKHRLTGEKVKAKSTDELIQMDVVESEFDDARIQLKDYRQKLDQKYDNSVRLKSYAVGIGFQRVLWEEVSS